jgi:outer membrane protein OmpA-like peptidoglycan-associated protein
MKPVVRFLLVLSCALLLVPTAFASGETSSTSPSPKTEKTAAAKKARDTATRPARAAAKAGAKADPVEKEQPTWKPMPATTGTLGAFTVETGETLPQKVVTLSAYVNQFDRAPGALKVTNVGWDVGVGLTNWLTAYVGWIPYTHIHVGRPFMLSEDSPVTNPEFDRSIYRLPFPSVSDRPSYVEDYPYAFTNNGGIGEVSLGVQFGLLQERRGNPFTLAVSNTAFIPTKTNLPDLLQNQAQRGAFSDLINVAVSKNIHHIVDWAFNFGYLFTRDPRFSNLTLFSGEPLGTETPVHLADEIRVGTAMIFFPEKRIQLIKEESGIIFVGTHTPNMTFGPRDPVEGVYGVRIYPTHNIALDIGYRYMLNLSQNNTGNRQGFIVKLSTAIWPKPAPDIVSVTCSADKNSVMEGSGEKVRITAQGSDTYGHALNYTWTATGGTVTGSGNTAEWDSTGAAPGTYTVTAHADDGHGNSSSCSEQIEVTPKPIPPPSMTCSAEHPTVIAGERVAITATVHDESGTPLTYTWHTNGGTILGSGPSVELDTTGLAPGTYTVTGRVENGKGGAADCQVQVTVQAPPVKPEASKINECLFRLHSARVDNVCKRVLDDVALRLKNEPKARVVIIGYATPTKSKLAAAQARVERLARERAENAKKYLEEKGVAADRVETRVGAGAVGAGKENRRIDIIWVPEGATY